MIIVAALIAFALVALIVVSAINRAQEKERMRRLQQRKLKVQVDAFHDILHLLENTIPNKFISMHINDEIIRLLRHILLLEKNRTSQHIEASIRQAQTHSETLINGQNTTTPYYQKDSDAQITQAQLHLTDAGKILSYLCTQGKFSEAELSIYLAELTWGYLMVSVATYIEQGHKFAALDDRVLAEGFYQKAQHLLVESTHANPHRVRLIKELGEIQNGTRTLLSRDLITMRPILDQAANF